jgi:hypothetical protein
LADDHAIAVGAQFRGEGNRPDEGDVHENGIEIDLARELDELGRRLVGADHDDGLGLGAFDGEQRRFDRDSISLEPAFGGDLHAALLHGLLEARKAGAAEGIVLIENGNFLDLQILDQVLGPGLGFSIVARSNIYDVGELAVAQERRAPR